jgi:hypothetical protein
MNYAALASRASAMIGKYGTTIAYKRYTKTVTGSSGAVAQTLLDSTTATAVILPSTAGKIEAFDNRRDDGSLKGLELRYLKVSAYAFTFTPKADDVITFGSRDWKVLGCTAIDPSGAQALVYGIGVMAL